MVKLQTVQNRFIFTNILTKKFLGKFREIKVGNILTLYNRCILTNFSGVSLFRPFFYVFYDPDSRYTKSCFFGLGKLKIEH